MGLSGEMSFVRPENFISPATKRRDSADGGRRFGLVLPALAKYSD
jgi:hypothetical protein